ncbi:MAG: hypothetical protein GTN38_00785 [Candidatus Aenigmarchaeota archaeon]|nr:hypothetical protein [Candidatus Aenigmarchaeota archaeon]NIP40122.1 hypothetical protein [Candidatus Aenigmarchaeota archaeon]NIQ18199.1 hypothetical protein [Candidatus Aenigmarchaeota archaeon]NIS72956.1 hypothetical protein [Candidatus Aenigmarchaeota archaeon]
MKKRYGGVSRRDKSPSYKHSKVNPNYPGEPTIPRYLKTVIRPRQFLASY